MAQEKGAGIRGVKFIRENPQLLYTIFLLIVIPLAFFMTSDRFLSVARDNQDRLERSRVALLQDVVSAFAPDFLSHPEDLESRIGTIVKENEPIEQFLALQLSTQGTYAILAQSGSVRLDAFTPDEGDAFLLKQSLVRPGETHLMERFIDGERYWDASRSVIVAPDQPVLYLYTRVSMANVDAIANRNVQNAYYVLFGIIFLVFILLLRQAKIVDYAALYRKLKEADQMKDDFVSMAAHELRSPLTIIRGYVDMLHDESMSEAGKRTLQHIDRSAGQLNLMVADILDVAKLQEGRMTFNLQTIDPSQNVKDVAESFRKPAEDKGLVITIDVPPLPQITIDPDRFRQVLINVIGNAVKYTPKGTVAVTAKKEGEKVEIRISDTGMGISADEQRMLFQKFYRVKSDETKLITGTGLGLWITHQIVHQMKGTIAVESIKGKGTDFILTFARAK